MITLRACTARRRRRCAHSQAHSSYDALTPLECVLRRLLESTRTPPAHRVTLSASGTPRQLKNDAADFVSHPYQRAVVNGEADRLPKLQLPPGAKVCFPKIFPRRAQNALLRQSHKSGPNHRTVDARAHQFPELFAPDLSLSATISLRPPRLRQNRSSEHLHLSFPE